ncbi:DEAD/DEAH box helicase family protein [Thermobrachium celere]|uniref:DEAD/DEAH box helicase family protein n=1 Tax=Thermobrachium celere TaxID=53422 RepID=UPI001944179D|nr:DEAD/DEAH box helicase family protein [Thermobrachium celere]GFR36487.1 hypothetical protein TCEA9_22990 [Thermobrachium celere]
MYNEFYKIKGEGEIKLRYYQILALYFTEYYFKNKNDEEFKEFDTNFLAYWMATGSGKTIIMHLNVLQYIEKLNKLRDVDNLQIILTTPGVNLIEQHKREFIPFIEFLNEKYNNKIDLIIDTTSSLLSLFNKSKGYFELIDNSKIQRLILVDEAHIGISSKDEGEFKKLRSELNKKQSFLFEYSATFYNLTSTIKEDYEKSIIFDYNYNLFF